MKVREYSLLCSQKLLEDIASDKFADALGRDNASLKPLVEAYPLEKDVDYRWQLISTGLLMSEGLFKNNKTYDLITPEILMELENALMGAGCISENRLLDYYNNPVYDFASLLPGGQVSFIDDMYDVDIEKLIEKHALEDKEEMHDNDYFFDDFLIERANEKKRASESNCSFIVDGQIKLINFVIMIRNALAHSSYEILDNNCIRLSHYNHDTKKLDMNIILNKEIVIPIIDIINEIVYKRYQDFYEYSFYEELSFSKYYGSYECSDEELIDYIMSFDVVDETIAKRILDTAKKTELFNTPSYDPGYAKPTRLEDYDNENKLKAILKTMHQYIKPICDYGVIINDMFYADNGFINADELMEKYNIYDYLKSEFFSSAYSMPNEPVYIENELRLKILSLLNCLLVTSINEVHNYNLDGIDLDFSAMKLSDETIKIFEDKQMKKNSNLMKSIADFFAASEKAIKAFEERLELRENLLENNYHDNDYFNVKLPEEIEKCKNEIQRFKDERLTKGILYKLIDTDMLAYNYMENLSNFILNALRNSLAHGNVLFDDSYEDIGDMKITFEDYDPESPAELTFKGTISLNELIKILISKENVDILRR